jgi:hypothetical protein
MTLDLSSGIASRSEIHLYASAKLIHAIQYTLKAILTEYPGLARYSTFHSYNINLQAPAEAKKAPRTPTGTENLLC